MEMTKAIWEAIARGFDEWPEGRSLEYAFTRDLTPEEVEQVEERDSWPVLLKCG